MFGGLPGSKQKIGQSFPRGTQLMFINAAAPYGWTRVSTSDDALLRIVGSAAPGSGGSNGFVATFNSQVTVGSTTLTAATIPAHTHNLNYTPNISTTSGAYNYPNVGGSGSVVSTDGGTGGGGAHNHSITTSIKYVDALLAKKN